MRKRFEYKRENKIKQVLLSLNIIEELILNKLNNYINNNNKQEEDNKSIIKNYIEDTPWFINKSDWNNNNNIDIINNNNDIIDNNQDNYNQEDNFNYNNNFHDITENYQINWKNIPSYIDPASGELEELRAKRKRQQLESLVILVEEEIKNCRNLNPCIIDFGAGSGHLGLIIAYRNPNVQVILAERKEYSVNVARERIQNCDLINVTIDQRNVQEILQELPRFDIGVSLHSCGQLTDLSLKMCYQSKASFVLTPCCYGQITNPPPIINSTNMLIDNFSSLDVEDKTLFSSIVSFADYSTCFFDSDDTNTGNSNNNNNNEKLNENNMKSFLLAKRCMRVIDFDRLISTCFQNIYQENNYQNIESERNENIDDQNQIKNNGYYIFRQASLKPLTCSPKNNVIIGRFIRC